jgi:hypothetical protein
MLDSRPPCDARGSRRRAEKRIAPAHLQFAKRARPRCACLSWNAVHPGSDRSSPHRDLHSGQNRRWFSNRPGGYRPVFTWTRFAESNTRFLNTIFYTGLFTTQRPLPLGPCALCRRSTIASPTAGAALAVPLVWVVLTPLPIAFLPDRGGPMLYILLVGWAMLAALSLRALARRLARDIVFKGIPRKPSYWLLWPAAWPPTCTRPGAKTG